MLVYLPHAIWLAASAVLAVWLLRPGSTSVKGLRLSAGMVLAVIAADALFWILGLTALQAPMHALAALAGGALAVGAVVMGTSVSAPAPSPTPTVDEQPRPTPAPTDAESSDIVEAITQWSEAAAIADAQGVLVWANAAWARAHEIAEPVGKTWDDFHAEKENGRWQWLVEQALKDGHAGGLLDHQSRAGGDAAAAWTSRAHLVTLADGGEKKVFMAAIRLSDDETKLRREAREIGHNLNNVLSAVVGNVGLAIETPGIDPTLQADLREAEEGALRAAQLIHGLQALARGEDEA